MGCGSGCTGCNQCGDVSFPEGTAGLDGLNSFTTTTANFVVPSVGGNVVINVSNAGQLTGSWGKPGEVVYIENAGWYDLVSATDTTMTVTNPTLYTAENAALAAVASTVNSPVKVGPGGTKGAAGSAGATGGTAIGVLDVDHDYATNTQNGNGYTLAKETLVPANTIGAIDDIIRIEMDVIGDDVVDILYGVKLEFGAAASGGVGGSSMFELDNIIKGGPFNLNAVKVVVDLIVTATGAQIIPYVSFDLGSGNRTTQNQMSGQALSINAYDPASTAAIDLTTDRYIAVYLKASGTGNDVSITSYKVFKLLKA